MRDWLEDFVEAFIILAPLAVLLLLVVQIP